MKPETEQLSATSDVYLSFLDKLKSFAREIPCFCGIGTSDGSHAIENLDGCYEINITKFPNHLGPSLGAFLHGAKDESPIAFRKYFPLAQKIKEHVRTHAGQYPLPAQGFERVLGWAVNGKNVLDVTSPVDDGFYGATFLASRHAWDIRKAGGVVMAWIHQAHGSSRGMFIWPVFLVIRQTNQTFAGL